MKKTKKALKILPTMFIFAFVILSFEVLAVTNSQYVQFSFNTGSGNAYVDGARNGVFYTLSQGSATLDLTDSNTCYEGGKYRLTLFKNSWLGQGHNCGTLVADNTGPFQAHIGTFTIPSDGDNYYFYGTGEGAYHTYAASGLLYQD